MRKFIKQWVNHKRGPASPLDKTIGWDVLEAHMSTVPCSWRPGIRFGICKAISDKDIALLHRMVARVDLFTTKYGKGQIPLETVVHDRNIVCLVKKQPLGDTIELSLARRQAGIRKLIEAEQRCARTNDRFRSEGFLGDSRVSLILSRARYICREILGELSYATYREILLASGPGGGATMSDRGCDNTLYNKVGENRISVTPSALGHFRQLLQVDHGWRDLLDRRPISLSYSRKTTDNLVDAQIERIVRNHVDLVSSDTVLFVPKDVRTDRPIALSASGNMMLQRGVSSVINEKLLAAGLDLREQGKNKRLALLGSKYPGPQSPCTIDLASASDTISTEFVKAVLPSDWFALLDDLRHKSGILSDEEKHVFRYQKFSAMGNGFTFQLETLLFYCVVRASLLDGMPSKKDVFCPRHIAVYGDDIIVRESQYDTVTKALQMCGFAVNHEKSFSYGSFKESCGGDYYNGQDVRGVYLKRNLRSVRDMYHLLNQIAVKCVLKTTPLTARYASIRSYRAILALLPKEQRIYGPLWGSDSWLICPLHRVTGTYYTPYLSSEEISYLRSKKAIGKGAYVHPYTPVALDLRVSKRPDNRRNRTSLYASLLLSSYDDSQSQYGSKLSLTFADKERTELKVVQCPVWDKVAEEVDLDWYP